MYFEKIDYEGECHRYPPTPLKGNDKHPTVSPHDYCGEWKKVES
jgi:hypothetical protein